MTRIKELPRGHSLQNAIYQYLGICGSGRPYRGHPEGVVIILVLMATMR